MEASSSFNPLFLHRQQKVRQNCQKIWRLVISKGLSNKWSQAPVILGVRILIAVGRETEAQKYQNTSQITQVTILYQ